MKELRVVAAVIVENDQVLCTRRNYGEFAGKWEFPGGKIESGESPEAALKREIAEELALKITVGEKLGDVEMDYPHFRLFLSAYVCVAEGGQLTLKAASEAVWKAYDQLEELDWLMADRKLLPLVQNYFLLHPQDATQRVLELLMAQGINQRAAEHLLARCLDEYLAVWNNETKSKLN